MDAPGAGFCPSSDFSGSAVEATRPKIIAAVKIVKFLAIRTVLGIGTGNSSAVVPVVPSDRSVECVEGAGRGDPKEIQIFATSNGVFAFL